LICSDCTPRGPDSIRGGFPLPVEKEVPEALRVFDDAEYWFNG
jgi:hypothetical protein